MMTLEQIQKLADEMGVDIEGHILSMPIERQVEFAKELGYGDDFDRYVKESLEDALKTQQDEEEGGYVLTAREALEEVPHMNAIAMQAIWGVSMAAIWLLRTCLSTQGIAMMRLPN